MLQLGIKLEKCYFGELGIGKRHMGNFAKEIQNQGFCHNTFTQFSAFMLLQLQILRLVKKLKNPTFESKVSKQLP